MSKILIDSNILIYAINKADQKSPKAVSFLQDNFLNAVISFQNITESLRVLTHPNNPHKITITKAISSLKSITDSIEIIYPKPGSGELLYVYAEEFAVSGLNLFDLQLVIVMLQNGINTIATCNEKDFRKYSVKVLNPFT